MKMETAGYEVTTYRGIYMNEAISMRIWSTNMMDLALCPWQEWIELAEQ